MRVPPSQSLSGDGSGGVDLPVQCNALIVGSAGTGKKAVALCRAKLIRDLGNPVQVLTFSRCLCAYLQGVSRGIGLEGDISAFHSWFERFYRQCYGSRPPQEGAFQYDWPRILHAVATDPIPKARLSHIVIMEAQDMPKGFWMVALGFAQHVTAFADDASGDYGVVQASLQEIHTALGPGSAVIRLTRNYRNTFEIAALASNFAGAARFGPLDLPTRHGALPVVWRVAGLAASVDLVSGYERENADFHVGVLVPTKRMGNTILECLQGRTASPVQSCLSGRGGDAGPPDFGAAGIMVVPFGSARCLEFDTVFLPEFQTYSGKMDPSQFRMTMYSMVSRARSNVFILHSGDEPLAPDSFKPGLVELR